MRNLALLALLFGCQPVETKTQVSQPQVSQPAMAARTRLPEVGWNVSGYDVKNTEVARGVVLKVEGTLVTLGHGPDGSQRAQVDWNSVEHFSRF